MSWRKFWKLGENYFDRFYTASVVIMVLDLVNGTAFHFSAILTCILIATLGGMSCAVCAAFCEPDTQATGTASGPT